MDVRVFDGDVTTTLHPRPRRMLDESGVRLGLASGAVVVALLVAGALPLDLGETAFVALVTAAATSVTLPWALALVVGTETWAFFTGFFENRYGVLTLGQGDLARLAGFVVATLVLAHLLRVPFGVARGGGR